MKMNYIKTIKKIRKYGKKLNKSMKQNGKYEKYVKNKKNDKNKKNGKTKNKAVEVLRNETPFYSVFASVQVQKEKNSAFLMLGNDVSNKLIPEEIKDEADEWTINTNVVVKIKN